MQGGLSFAFGCLFGACFALLLGGTFGFFFISFALAFFDSLAFRLAKYSNFFRRLCRQRLLNDYAKFIWMMRADNFEHYLQIRNKAWLSETLPDNRLELSLWKLWRRLDVGKRNRRRSRR